MQTSRTRLAAASAATMALLIAGTAAVSAHPGDREDFPGNGPGMGRMGGAGWQEDGPLGWRGDMGGLGLGRMGRLGGLMGVVDGDVVRREVIIQTEDGTVTQRTDLGTVSTAGEASLDYTLATGETATVLTDEDTEVISVALQTLELGNSGRTRDRLVPETVALADIPAGAEIVVWAESQADGSFLAQRILVRPAVDEAVDDGAAESSDVAGAEITEVPASPAPADA
jgi:hypothetical protein